MTPAVADHARSERNPRLDACRIFASVAILYMHTFEAAYTPTPGEICRFAVPFFTCSAFYLLLQAFRHRPNRPFVPYLTNRFVRLYVPFLAWGALGLLLMNLKHHFVSHQPLQGVDWNFFTTGDSLQLWFLPFLFVSGVLMFPVCRGLIAIPEKWQPLAGVLLIAMAYGLAILFSTLSADVHSRWQPLIDRHAFAADAAPGIFLGIAMGLIARKGSIPGWVGWIGLLMMVGFSLYTRYILRAIAIENTAGLGLLLFAIAGTSFPMAGLCNRYAFLAYGIYLSQNVVLEPVQTILIRRHVSPTVPVELCVFLVVLMLTTGLSIVLSKSKLTRWLLG